MSLKVPNWEPNIVYLVQPPRTHSIPNFSQFSMKMETWLRLADIPYKNVNGGLSGRSNKGLVPFVELNGEQIADTYFIINELTKKFNKESMEEHLSEEEKAQARAFELLVEGSIVWAAATQRSRCASMIFTDALFLPHVPPIGKLLRPLLVRKLANGIKARTSAQGMGRHTPEELLSIAETDLKALSVFVAQKPFFMGDRPTRVDATVFANVVAFLYTPMHPELKQFLQKECGNLIEYAERIKTTYWPDWDKACAELSLQTQWKMANKQLQVITPPG